MTLLLATSLNSAGNRSRRRLAASRRASVLILSRLGADKLMGAFILAWL